MPDGSAVSFENAGEVYATPPPFADAEPPHKMPLTLDTVISNKQVWVEPISSDSFLRDELRGQYEVRGHWVENDRGSRFYLSAYGVKWLAYQKEN